MSLEDFKKKILELRSMGPTPTNQPNVVGPLCIDPVNYKQIDLFFE